VLNYVTLSKNPEHFRNFTGLKLEEFNTLNQQITQKYPEYEQKRLHQRQPQTKSRSRTPLQTKPNQPTTNPATLLPPLHLLHPTRIPLRCQPNKHPKKHKKTRTPNPRNLAHPKQTTPKNPESIVKRILKMF